MSVETVTAADLKRLALELKKMISAVAMQVDRLAVDLVEDTVEDQLSYAGRSVHDTTDPTRQ